MVVVDMFRVEQDKKRIKKYLEFRVIRIQDLRENRKQLVGRGIFLLENWNWRFSGEIFKEFIRVFYMKKNQLQISVIFIFINCINEIRFVFYLSIRFIIIVFNFIEFRSIW